MISLYSQRLKNGWLMAGIKDIVGKNILRLISESKDINQAKLARIVEKTPTSVSHWIAGKNLPDAESLEKIAAYFGVDVYKLFIPDSEFKPNIRPQRKMTKEDLLRELLAIEGFSLKRKTPKQHG